MNIWGSFIKSVIYFVVAFVFVLGVVWAVAKIRPAPQVNVPIPTPIVIVKPMVTCPADALSYSASIKDGGKVVKLISDRKNMYAARGEFINRQIVITKNETTESKVACGYLFVRAGTGDSGPLRSWEDVVINPNEFGGHIDPKNQFGSGDGRLFSEYLFSLSDIQYWKTHARSTVSHVDWAALFNVQDSVKFQIALNTEDRTGFIDELSIAYKCWNPATGEENAGCKLDITGNPDDTTVNHSLQ